MELRHLAGFVAVAEELHFGRAAKRLHMAQSPLSQQIRTLERDLGVTLFDRSTRSVTLTAAGSSLLGSAREALEAAEAVRRTARAAGRGEVGRISIGFAGTSSAAALPVLTRAVATELPGIELALDGPAYSGETLARVARGDLDLTFAAALVDARGFRQRIIRRDPLFLAVADTHPLAAAGEVDLADLAGEPFVTFPSGRGSQVHEIGMRSCLEAGFAPHVLQEAPDTFTLLALVGAGVGVALVVEAARRITLDHVAFVPLAAPVPVMATSLAWRRTPESAALRAVLDVSERVLPTLTG